jgi:hypothetical protein
MEKLQVLYEQMIQDDELMQELEDIINYSASTIKSTINNGVEIYEIVEDKIIINPIGIIPLDTKEGYFFKYNFAKTNTGLSLSSFFFEKHDEKYRKHENSLCK